MNISICKNGFSQTNKSSHFNLDKKISLCRLILYLKVQMKQSSDFIIVFSQQ